MIELKNVKKEYSDTVIQYKDMAFEDGKSYVILGASGCGKSTLINMIGGQMECTSGSLTVNGEYLIDLCTYKRKAVSYIRQDSTLFEDLTVKDNLEFKGSLVNQQVDYGDLLNRMELPKSFLKRKVKTLSGGERQRVLVMQALICDNKAHLLCDEPTGALNSELAHKVIKTLVNKHKELGTILIVVTHDSSLVEYFDEVIDAKLLLKKEGELNV